jgi:hypothetical protein
MPSRTRQTGLVLHGLAARGWLTQGFAGLKRRGLTLGSAERALHARCEPKPQGWNEAGRGAWGLSPRACLRITVDCSGGLGGNGRRGAGLGVWMGGKWL